MENEKLDLDVIRNEWEASDDVDDWIHLCRAKRHDQICWLIQEVEQLQELAGALTKQNSSQFEIQDRQAKRIKELEVRNLALVTSMSQVEKQWEDHVCTDSGSNWS